MLIGDCDFWAVLYLLPCNDFGDPELLLQESTVIALLSRNYYHETNILTTQRQTSTIKNSVY